jgi:hypothetical protein
MTPRRFCQHGHELTPENTITVGANGNRRCRICYNIYQRRTQQRHAFLQQQDPDRRQRELIQNILRLRGATSVPREIPTVGIDALIYRFLHTRGISDLTSGELNRVTAELDRRELSSKRKMPTAPRASNFHLYDPPLTPAPVRHIPIIDGVLGMPTEQV